MEHINFEAMLAEAGKTWMAANPPVPPVTNERIDASLDRYDAYQAAKKAKKKAKKAMKRSLNDTLSKHDLDAEQKAQGVTHCVFQPIMDSVSG